MINAPSFNERQKWQSQPPAADTFCNFSKTKNKRELKLLTKKITDYHRAIETMLKLKCEN